MNPLKLLLQELKLLETKLFIRWVGQKERILRNEISIDMNIILFEAVQDKSNRYINLSTFPYQYRELEKSKRSTWKRPVTPNCTVDCMGTS